MPSPVGPAVELTDDERAELIAWSRRQRARTEPAYELFSSTEVLGRMAMQCVDLGPGPWSCTSDGAEGSHLSRSHRSTAARAGASRPIRPGCG